VRKSGAQTNDTVFDLVPFSVVSDNESDTKIQNEPNMVGTYIRPSRLRRKRTFADFCSTTPNSEIESLLSLRDVRVQDRTSAELRSQVKTLQTDNAQLATKLAELRSQVKTLQTDNAQLVTNLKTAEKANRKANMQSPNKQQEAKSTQLAIEFSTQNNLLKTTQLELEQLKKKLTATERQLDKAASKLERLLSEHASKLQRQGAQSVTDQAKVAKDHAAAMRVLATEKETLQAESEKEKVARERVIADLQNQNRSLNEEVNFYKQQLSIKEKHEASLIADFKAKRANFKKQLECAPKKPLN
jgi:myosin heavy subunit